MTKVRIIFKKGDIEPADFKSVVLCIEWLKANGIKPFKQRNFSDYFRTNPGSKMYLPRNKPYIVQKLED